MALLGGIADEHRTKLLGVHPRQPNWWNALHGVTNNLVRRVYEHKMGQADGFTKKYSVHRLVYFEQYGDIEAAILREKKLKKWQRAWKIRLIEELNPNWDDLYPQIAQP